MNDFNRCNKVTGVYWLHGTIDELKINIRLKPPDDIVSLPKFEDFTNETGNVSLQQNIEEFTFKWQEKCFSQWEVQRYQDVHNCLTENELDYHELVKSQEGTPGKIFTYTHLDYYLPLPQRKSNDVSLLSSMLKYLSLDSIFSGTGDTFEKSTSERHLFKSQEDINEEDEQWTAMHVVFDNSDYNEDGLVLKHEATLLSMYHNTVQNFIILSPDVNDLETNPYAVEMGGEDVVPDGNVLKHQYAVGVEFGAQRTSEELDTLLLSVLKKWELKHKQVVGWRLTPLGVSRWQLCVELESARGFPVDELYIQYQIQPPASAVCRDPLQGRSPASRARASSAAPEFHFGHLLELRFELGAGAEAGEVQLYLEAVSRDAWGRHRTEGYSRLALPLAPGAGCRELRCVRPDERGAAHRRFFLGGCHLLASPDVLAAPHHQGGEYTYTETGSVTLRTWALVERGAGRGAGDAARGAPTGAGDVVRGAEAALARYRRARSRLALAARL